MAVAGVDVDLVELGGCHRPAVDREQPLTRRHCQQRRLLVGR
jgi:hypothetical protein